MKATQILKITASRMYFKITQELYSFDISIVLQNRRA